MRLFCHLLSLFGVSRWARPLKERGKWGGAYRGRGGKTGVIGHRTTQIMYSVAAIRGDMPVKGHMAWPLWF